MRIQPIVEGDGEVPAMPVLLRRLLEVAQTYQISVNSPFRVPRGKMKKETVLRKYVSLARMQEDCAGIVVLFDADDECPKITAPQFESWVRAEAREIPCFVVMANREYEAWFLASLESLRGIRGIRPDANSIQDPEIPRDAKGMLERHMLSGRSYAETTDQAALTARFDLRMAFERCRSFRHLVTALGVMLQQLGCEERLPPDGWRDAAG